RVSVSWSSAKRSGGATKQEKHRFSCEHRGVWKLAGRSGLLPAFWKVTNELPVDVARGEGVACGDQFPMQLRDVVTTSFPPLCHRFEVRIEPGPSLGRLLWRRRRHVSTSARRSHDLLLPEQRWPFARSPARASPRLADIGPDALLAWP